MKLKTVQREKILLIVTVGVLSLLALDKLILTPFVENYESNARKIDQLNESIAKGELLLNREDTIEGMWKDLVDSSLSKDNKENLLLSKVEAWKNKSGLELQTVKPEHLNSKRNGPERLECRLFAKGTYEQVCQFLYHMRTDNLNINVERCDIVSKNESGTSFHLIVHFSSVILDGVKPS